jgi:hypothetical protein
MFQHVRIKIFLLCFRIFVIVPSCRLISLPLVYLQDDQTFLYEVFDNDNKIVHYI